MTPHQQNMDHEPDAEPGLTDQPEPVHRVACHLGELLTDRGITLTELATRTGITVVNLSVLKNNRARAVRFTTLTAICDALHCQPADLLTVPPALSRSQPDPPAAPPPP